MPILSLEFIRQLDRLRIRSQDVFRGQSKGENRSLNRGNGIEFADYRGYEVGDDLRYLDWGLYARSNRLFIKLFQAEEDLPISILVDRSESMNFGEPTKLTCAKQIAASLAYIGLAGGDRTALYAFSDRLIPIVPSTSGKAQFPKLSKALETIDTVGKTDLTACMQHFFSHSKQSGIAVIISDFLDMTDLESVIKGFLARKFGLTLIHVLAVQEIEPQLSGDWRLEDVETGRTRELTINERMVLQYRQRLQTFCTRLRQFCVNRGANYVRTTSQVAIDHLILHNLQKMGTVR